MAPIDLTQEPSLAASALRRWVIVAMAGIAGIAAIFVIDWARGPSQAAQVFVTVYQPTEFESERMRPMRYAAEQADIIASRAIAELVADDLDMTIDEVVASTKVVHDIKENLILIRFDVAGDGAEAGTLAVEGANAVANRYLTTVEASAGERVSAWASLRRYQVSVALEALIELDELGEYTHRPRLERRLINLFDTIEELIVASERVLKPVRFVENANTSFDVELAARPVNLLLGLTAGVAVASFGFYGIDLRGWLGRQAAT